MARENGRTRGNDGSLASLSFEVNELTCLSSTETESKAPNTPSIPSHHVMNRPKPFGILIWIFIPLVPHAKAYT